MSTKVTTDLIWNGREAIKDFDKAMYKSLYAGASIVEADAKANVHSGVTNQLRSSIDKVVSSKKAVIGSNAEHAPYYEFGTRPHKAPIKALKPWADLKGIPVGALWMSIARKGTKAHPFLMPALTKNIKKIIAVFAKNNINLKWVNR